MRLFGYCVAALLGAGCAHAAPGGPVRTEAATFRVTEVAGGLDEPWALAFLPDGGMLVTEKPGRLRLIEEGELREAPVPGTPEVFGRDQGSLLDITLDPDFAENSTIYLSYAHAEGNLTTTRVMRTRYAPDGLTGQKVIFEAKPLIESTKHFGSRFAWGGDGTLYLTMGERSNRRELAQDLSTHLGKVMRINKDGTAPPDNPFAGRPGVMPEIFSYGHRNPQGLAINPATGEIWEQEHGARGGDEVNILKPGANYGWPDVAYGVNYDGSTIGTGQRTAQGVEAPLFHWDPSIAPSGMMFYTGDKFPGWQGDLFVGALASRLVSRLDLDAEGKVVKEERFLARELGRIRDIRQGPDGLVYIVTDQSPGGVYRLEPVAGAG
jgi:glucose/arabinose dehydrogenase